MACCLAAAMVIALVRRTWYRLFPSRAPIELMFAPPARRPAPGITPAAHPTAPATHPPLAPAQLAPAIARPRPSLGRPIGLWAAASVVTYIATTWIAQSIGLLPPEPEAVLGSLPRDLAAASLVAAALIVAQRGQPALASRRARAAAFMSAGLTWSLLAIVDLHLLRTFDAEAHGLAVSLLLHGTGLAALYAGLLLRARRPSPTPTSLAVGARP